MTDIMQTRDQILSDNVYKHIDALKWHSERDKQKINAYGALANKLPALIRSAGLVQALAYVEARMVYVKKPKEGHIQLYTDLRSILGWSDPASALISSKSLSLYMYETRRSLAALSWFKRYAQSVLKFEPGSEDENE
jgi:CRISPR-associated protein Cmr5